MTGTITPPGCLTCYWAPLSRWIKLKRLRHPSLVPSITRKQMTCCVKACTYFTSKRGSLLAMIWNFQHPPPPHPGLETPAGVWQVFQAWQHACLQACLQAWQTCHLIMRKTPNRPGWSLFSIFNVKALNVEIKIKNKNIPRRFGEFQTLISVTVHHVASISRWLQVKNMGLCSP